MECMAAVLTVITSSCKVDEGVAIPWTTSALIYLGYFTTSVVLFLPVINTFSQVWHMKAVGDLRGEPLVASLLSYACSLYFSLLDNHWKFTDSAWINLTGLIFYVVYLGLFLKYADHADRRATMVKWIPLSTAYIVLIVAAGQLAKSTPAVKWMYMLAGLVSACTPLGLALFVLEKNVQNLPDWLSSAVGLIHYSVWVVRSLIPERDYFDLVQNASGTICSIYLLVLLFQRRAAEAGLGVDLYAPLLANQHLVLQVEAHDGPVNEAEGGAIDEGQAAVIIGGQAGAINEAQGGAINQVQGAVINDAINQGQAAAINVAQDAPNDEAQDGAINQVQGAVINDAINQGQAAAINVAQDAPNDEAQGGAINQVQGAVINDAINQGQAAAINVAQDAPNDEAQAGAINQVQGAVINEPQAGAANNEGQAAVVNQAAVINNAQAGAMNEAQAGANPQPQPKDPPLQDPRKVASAPTTPKKVAALRRSSSCGLL